MDLRVGFFLVVLALLAVVSALLVLPLLQYVAAAALLAFVLVPLHDRLTGARVDVGLFDFTVGPRVSAALLTGFALVAAILPLLFFTLVVFRTVVNLADAVRETEVLPTVREIAYRFGIEEELVEVIEAHVLEEIDATLEAIVQRLIQEVIGLLDLSIRVGIGVLVFVFLLYYFLADGRRLVAWAGAVAPLDDEVQERLLDEVNVVTWAVMKSHVFVAVIEGVLAGLGLYALGVPNAAFWTVVMIVVSFLPVIGIWLVWAPAVVFLVVTDEFVRGALLLVYGITVLSVVDNYLRAILVDRGSGLHPAVVLVGVIGGIYLFGILSLFLGPVILAVFKAALQVFGEVYQTDGTETGVT